MNDPTYKLEGIIHTRDELEDFEGPLSLILTLLQKNKIEIRDVRISLIFDQYIEYIESLNRLDLEVASEFVQMASHLLYIKTQMLLSGDKEISELEELMASLEQMQSRDLYVVVQAVAPLLEDASRRGMYLMDKPPEPLPVQSGEYRYSHEPAELLEALAVMATRPRAEADGEAGRSVVAVPRPIVFDVRRKSSQIFDLLRQKGSLSVRALMALCRSRSEKVATFLSLLEMCSGGEVGFSGETEDLQVYLNTDAEHYEPRASEFERENETDGRDDSGTE